MFKISNYVNLSLNDTGYVSRSTFVNVRELSLFKYLVVVLFFVFLFLLFSGVCPEIFDEVCQIFGHCPDIFGNMSPCFQDH